MTVVADRRSPVSPATPSPIVTAVPRDLVVRVGRLAGFAVYYEAGTPFYKEAVEFEGKVRDIEIEFLLPHICFRIMNNAPAIRVVRSDAGYQCALKAGQPLQHGGTLVEAVFRAFEQAKREAKANG